jgi:hypothetical protein
MPRVARRVRAYVLAVKRGEAIFGPSLVILLLLLAVVWVGYRSSPQEAVGQTAAPKTGTGEATTPLAKALTEEIAEAAAPKLVPDLAEPAPANRRPRGIPGLSEMDLIGYLQYMPGSNFRCLGGSPIQGGLYSRSCTSSSDEEPPVVYEVKLVEENSSAVRSVTANAYDTSDDDAADFFTYVAELSLQGTGPMNPETWIGENISLGGQYPAEGAILRLYGTEGARTMEIVATGVPSNRIPEARSRPRPTGRD